MPTYHYLCPKGHGTEQVGHFDDDTIVCSVCYREAKRRAVYATQYIIGDTVRKASGRLGPDPFDMALNRARTENVR